MAPPKINIKERYMDGEVDLSMSDLHEVPVKALALFPKTHTLDLSNNHLEILPLNFCSLSNLIKLDLSKNELRELPDNFGDLTKLKHLDLYHNNLEYLPMSFSKLKALKWLDLKDNPLVPAVAKIAGPCLDTKDCQECAKKVVDFFTQVQAQVETDLEVKQRKQKKAETKIVESKKAHKKNKKKKDKEGVKNAEHEAVFEENQTLEGGNKFDKLLGPKPREKSIKKKSFPWLTLCLISCLGIFILTSVNCTYTESVENRVRNIYHGSFDLLPQNYHTYLKQFGFFVGNIHNQTGGYTLEMITFVKTNENLMRLYDLLQNETSKFKQYIHSLWNNK